MIYQRHNGPPFKLGNKIGGSSEISVFQTSISGQAAKMFDSPPLPEKILKLKAMMARGQPCPGMAWPSDIIEKQGKAVGYLMPMFDGQTLCQITNPKSQPLLPPSYIVDGHFLYLVGSNLLALVTKLHQFNIVVGNLNDANFLVAANADVFALDCDSFQVGDHLCELGRLEFTAPELQKATFNTTRRAPSADVFSLTILLYQLCVLGQHPYLATDSPTNCDELHKRIQQRICPLLGTAKPSTITPSLNYLPPALIDVFKQGLDDQSSRPAVKTIATIWAHHDSIIIRTITTYQQQIGIKHTQPFTRPMVKRPQKVKTPAKKRYIHQIIFGTGIMITAVPYLVFHWQSDDKNNSQIITAEQIVEPIAKLPNPKPDVQPKLPLPKPPHSSAPPKPSTPMSYPEEIQQIFEQTAPLPVNESDNISSFTLSPPYDAKKRLEESFGEKERK